MIRRQAGQGLLEVIIGIGVIIAGTVGTVTLVTQTIKAGRTSNNQIVASNLAREAIEIVRNIRDQNWLKIQANVDVDPGAGFALAKTFDGIVPAPVGFSPQAIAVFDSTTNTWSLRHLTIDQGNNVDPCASLAITWNCLIVFRDSVSGGLAQRYDTSPPGPATQFRRSIALWSICRKDDAPTDGIPDDDDDDLGNITPLDCAAGQILVGVQITVGVGWDEAGISKSYVLGENLYNWKYLQ